MRIRSEKLMKIVAPVDVLIFNHTSVMSGGEIALLDLVREGLANKVHVHVDKSGPLSQCLQDLPGVSWSAARMDIGSRAAEHLGTVHRLQAIILRIETLLKMRKDYANVLKQYSSPTVYANTLRSVLVLSTLPLHGRRLIFHQRDQLTPAYLGKVSALLSRLLIRVRVAHIIANSASTALSSPLSSARTSVIPSAVADSFYELPPAPSQATPKLIMLGRLSPWKGQLEFLRSLVVLRDELKNSNWQAEIVGGALFGEFEYESKLKTFIKEHELDAWVSLRGHITGVESVLSTGHILVHASILPEPFGQVVVQGMAAARAVVAANSGGPLETIDHERTGLLVDPSQSLQLAKALDNLIRDRSLRAKLGAAAREAASRYRIDLVARQVSVVLQSEPDGAGVRGTTRITGQQNGEAGVSNDEKP